MTLFEATLVLGIQQGLHYLVTGHARRLEQLLFDEVLHLVELESVTLQTLAAVGVQESFEQLVGQVDEKGAEFVVVGVEDVVVGDERNDLGER